MENIQRGRDWTGESMGGSSLRIPAHGGLSLSLAQLGRTKGRSTDPADGHAGSAGMSRAQAREQYWRDSLYSRNQIFECERRCLKNEYGTSEYYSAEQALCLAKEQARKHRRPPDFCPLQQIKLSRGDDWWKDHRLVQDLHEEAMAREYRRHADDLVFQLGENVEEYISRQKALRRIGNSRF